MNPERIRRLMSVIQTLSESLEADSLLQAIADEAAELTSSVSAAILRYHSSGGVLSFAAAPLEQREALVGTRLPVEGSAAERTFQRAEALRGNAREGIPYADVARLAGPRPASFLVVPLMFRGKPLGALAAVNKKDGAEYTDEDAAILETLASLAAFALHAHELQEQAERARAEMATLERLKSDFIAITSHELRTPLGLILGHATFLRELVEAKYREQLDHIIRYATRLKEIVESLARVDDYQSGAARVRQRQVSIARLARDVFESFREEARRKGVDLRVETGETPLTVEGEAGKIEVALSHLVRNAITFTDAGGHVTILAEETPDGVKVSVVDDGIGIPAADLERVFERFYQVESHLTRKHGGMGLGLSVAKAMIEMHGGRIWAESVEGQGSRFIFVLPAHGRPPSAPETSAP